MKTLLADLRDLVNDLRLGFRELFRPTWPQEDRPDLEQDVAVRTEWVRKNRHPEGR